VLSALPCSLAGLWHCMVFFLQSVTIGAKPLLQLLYARKYHEHWLLVGLFGVNSTVSTAMGMFVLLLKARGETRVVSGIWAMSAVLIAALGTPCMYLAGVEGALAAAMFAYMIALFKVYSHTRKNRGKA